SSRQRSPLIRGRPRVLPYPSGVPLVCFCPPQWANRCPHGTVPRDGPRAHWGRHRLRGAESVPAANPDLIAWIDTETTGRDPDRDRLLEIAVAVTRTAPSGVGSLDIVVCPYGGVDAATERIGPFVSDMHTASGLSEGMAGPAAHSPPVADSLTAGAIDRLSQGHPGPFLLGGNSITHDRGFLRVHAPQTFSRLHYRSIDVSGIEQEMARDGYAARIAAWREDFAPSNAHRALGDIRDSSRQLAALRAIRRGEVSAT